MPVSSLTSESQRLTVPSFVGAADELMTAADRECCMDGPAGTGKSYAALWKMHLRRIMFPGSRGLLARKTLISLKSSTLVTYKEQVLGPLLTSGQVKYWGARGDEPAHYAYWNGSKEVIVGLDDPGKAMSTQYDDVLVDEALDTEEEDIEALLSRINRPGQLFGVPGRPPYAQLTLVTNPGAPTHWLNQRMLSGRTRRLISRHGDNPAMTQSYLEMLDKQLTGVRRDRLYLGLWAAAEGTVYEGSWDRARNIISRNVVCHPDRATSLFGDCGIPHDWPRYLAIDFGYTHPFVCQWWARDHDGRLYRYRELYTTHRLVEDLAKEIVRLSGWGKTNGDPLPYAVICDHDAEDRATLERHLEMNTLAAKKSVSDGIQAVAARLRPAGDGKPRLYLLRDSLVARDHALLDAKKPLCTEDEVESYIWNDRQHKDEPVKDSDHGCFIAGTMVETLDGPQAIETIVPGTLVLTRQGYKPVLASGMTQTSAEIALLQLSDGRELTGTPDHPVYHSTKGYIPLRALRYNDRIELASVYRERWLAQWVEIKASQSVSSTRESSSAATPNRSNGQRATTTPPTPVIASAELASSIGKSGRTPTAPSQTVLRFITGITIPSIMRWITSNSSAKKITTPTTPMGAALMRSDASVSRLSASATLPAIGTSLMRGGPGIVNWRHSPLRQDIASLGDATTVVQNMRQITSLLQDLARASAPTHARAPHVSPPAKTMSSATARSAASRSRSTATAPSNAAPAHVLSACALDTRAPVYNLTVADAHEYFANGILVHNCDALRYMVAHLDLVGSTVEYVDIRRWTR